MKSTPHRICSNCVMDTTDPKNTFDERGFCRHCRNFYGNILPNWHTDERGQAQIRRVAATIKREGTGKDFDCILGMSGGLDSSYLAYIAKDLGLRPLIFHVDAGWNSQTAVHNIEKLVQGLNLDLYTEVINWEEMRDLQLAFFKSGVAHLDTPQDHAYYATMYNFAVKYRIKYILNGGNFSTECVDNPLEWHYHASDLVQLRDIHRKFGSRPLNTFPQSNIMTYKVYYRYFKGVRVIRLLNYVPYLQKDATAFLKSEFGWQEYPHKHYESRFTKFYEGFWKPAKFGIDMRKVQYSSLILTQQMTRRDALDKLSLPAYDKLELANEFEYVATKLGIAVEELQSYLDAPNKSYRDYRNQCWKIQLGAWIMHALGMTRSLVR